MVFKVTQVLGKYLAKPYQVFALGGGCFEWQAFSEVIAHIANLQEVPRNVLCQETSRQTFVTWNILEESGELTSAQWLTFWLQLLIYLVLYD